MAEQVTVYLSLGSNLGNRQGNLDQALKLLSQRMQVGKVSSIYDTEPVGNANQPRYLNLVSCAIEAVDHSNSCSHNGAGKPRVVKVEGRGD